MQFVYKNFCYSIINETKKTVCIGNTSSTNMRNAVYDANILNIYIPQFVYNSNKKYEVIEVSNNAFLLCNLTKYVSIPCSIIAIRMGGFKCMINVETYGFSRMYKLKTLALPYSILSLDDQCLACLISLQDLYICSSTSITSDVFRDNNKDDLTNINLRIHIPRTYEGTYFGKRTNLIDDYFSNECIFSSHHSCKPRNYKFSIIQLLVYQILLYSK